MWVRHWAGKITLWGEDEAPVAGSFAPCPKCTPRPFPPRAAGALGLWGFPSRKEAREVGWGAHAPLSPGKSWSGSPKGPGLEGAPVSSQQLETAAPPVSGSLVFTVTCDSALVWWWLSSAGTALRVWDVLWGALFEKETPLWVQASPFASPKQIPTWRVLSVSLCVYCTALADTLLSTCFHLMEDIFL